MYVAEWIRALNIVQRDWNFSVSMVWVHMPLLKNKNVSAQESNSNTVELNFQRYLYYCNLKWVCGYATFLFMYFGLNRNPKNIKTPLIIEQELCIQIHKKNYNKIKSIYVFIQQYLNISYNNVFPYGTFKWRIDLYEKIFFGEKQISWKTRATVNRRRTDNTMIKRKRSKGQRSKKKLTHKIKDRVIRTPLKNGGDRNWSYCCLQLRSSQFSVTVILAITIVPMHVPFKIHNRNNLIDKKDSYLIPRPPSWDDPNYSYGDQLYPSG